MRRSLMTMSGLRLKSFWLNFPKGRRSGAARLQGSLTKFTRRLQNQALSCSSTKRPAIMCSRAKLWKPFQIRHAFSYGATHLPSWLRLTQHGVAAGGRPISISMIYSMVFLRSLTLGRLLAAVQTSWLCVTKIWLPSRKSIGREFSSISGNNSMYRSCGISRISKGRWVIKQVLRDIRIQVPRHLIRGLQVSARLFVNGGPNDI